MKKITFLLIFTTILGCSSSSDEPLRTGNSITSFQLQIDGEQISGQINQTNKTIVFNVTDANLVSLAPSITISEGASISPSANTPRDFNDVVSYTVTAENGSTRTYSVIVNNTILSKENSITSFGLSINGEVLDGEINQTNSTITFNVVGADVVSLTPEIVFSEKASISPSTDTPQNFSEPVMYTVTAENGEERMYTVIVNNRPLNTESNILSFIVGINGEDIEARIDQNTKEIAFETGSFNISKLRPEIEISENATISPASGEEVDFTIPVTYTVTAENGEQSVFTIIINQAYAINAYTMYGPRWGAQKLYTGAKLYIVTDFLDPQLTGAQLYLSNGTSRIDLPIEFQNVYENQRVISYYMTTEIPDTALTAEDYKIFYSVNDILVESDFLIDILAENAPKITGINQESYSPGDTLIVTGENLTDLIGVQNNNASFYVFNPAGQVTTTLNPEKTEYTVLMEECCSFSHSAFFYYGGNTRDVIFIGPDQRMGEQITISVTQ